MLSVSFFTGTPGALRSWLIAALLMGLAGCSSMVTPEMKRLPDRVELTSIPFFRGNAYQSGPMVLASARVAFSASTESQGTTTVIFGSTRISAMSSSIW